MIRHQLRIIPEAAPDGIKANNSSGVNGALWMSVCKKYIRYFFGCFTHVFEGKQKNRKEQENVKDRKFRYHMEGFIFEKYTESAFTEHRMKETGYIPRIPGKIPSSES